MFEIGKSQYVSCVHFLVHRPLSLQMEWITVYKRKLSFHATYKSQIHWCLLVWCPGWMTFPLVTAGRRLPTPGSQGALAQMPPVVDRLPLITGPLAGACLCWPDAIWSMFCLRTQVVGCYFNGIPRQAGEGDCSTTSKHRAWMWFFSVTKRILRCWCLRSYGTEHLILNTL